MIAYLLLTNDGELRSCWEPMGIAVVELDQAIHWQNQCPEYRKIVKIVIYNSIDGGLKHVEKNTNAMNVHTVQAFDEQL